MAQRADLDDVVPRPSQDTASVSGSSTSDKATRRQSRSRSHKNKKNGSHARDEAQSNDANHSRSSARDKRRHSNSLSKAARDPRDEPPTKKRAAATGSTEIVRSPSPIIDFEGLSRPSLGTRERQEETPEQAALRMEKMRGAVRTLLECVGEDPDREGLLDTPSRYAKALMFLTSGYQVDVKETINNALFNESHNELIIVKNIEIHSLCEHHLVPFIGKMHIGYIPHNTVIGLSKLPRIAEMYARRLQIQERLTKEVANAIREILKPRGVAVVMESSHLCMVMRGVEQTATSTITSCMLGCFERSSKTRAEFLSLVGLNKASRAPIVRPAVE
ncbi:GTP cyclohydrolase 1 [Claviceps purpurea]|nr:GTP cyclohydrolase 1 [Claviceps purpurea]KAG6289045.1 GTP cyclohydrolase 1 [Claviceps aff. purpurea]KAG6143884.1 GTP cyclohydrolase 1 [Claviceps purpurea]KAG6160369.1 GTP cyclohydrolase 1 [Claviceps purpurea]KAG6165280.1 GTP cyclohydrolase 1 [Claviceps purpurea]